VHDIPLVQPTIRSSLGDVALAIRNARAVPADPEKEKEEGKGKEEGGKYV
jgi:hypothetical protein